MTVNRLSQMTTGVKYSSVVGRFGEEGVALWNPRDHTANATGFLNMD